jgi:NADH dehydrogenase
VSRVLVAGATGVLGRHLVPALKARGHHVRALARSRARSATLLGIADEVVTGDALDPRTLDGSCVR